MTCNRAEKPFCAQKKVNARNYKLCTCVLYQKSDFVKFWLKISEKSRNPRIRWWFWASIKFRNVYIYIKILVSVRYNEPPKFCTKTPLFTLSSRLHEARQERECDGYICLVCHILDLFLSRLEALWNMSVNCTRVKGHESLSSLFKLRSTLSRSSRTRVWTSTFVRTSSRSHLTESLHECLQWECKPGIMYNP